MTFSVWRCERCGRRSFPRRELCPSCAGRAFVPEETERGVVTELTTHRGAHVACVRIGDLRVLMRAEGVTAAGSEVALRVADDGAPVAAGV